MPRFSRQRDRVQEQHHRSSVADCFRPLALLAITLLRSCSVGGASAGAIFAVFRYVLMFVMALDSLPLIVQQVSRIRDVHRRLQPDA